MIDWGLALKLSIGAYGTNIVVLVILLLVVWVVGLLLQKYQPKGKEDPKKE